MVNRKVLLLTQSSGINTDPLNHHSKLTATTVDARVTELNGAQQQLNTFGEQYDHSWVVRVLGDHQADFVAFPDEYDAVKQKPKYTLTQVRRHYGRTDFYAVGTKVTSNELGQRSSTHSSL